MPQFSAQNSVYYQPEGTKIASEAVIFMIWANTGPSILIDGVETFAGETFPDALHCLKTPSLFRVQAPSFHTSPTMSLPQPSMQGSPTQIPAFDNTLGALLIGGLVTMALWGVTCVQAFTFFTRVSTLSRDTMLLKLLIAFLWLLDTFDSALNVHILYYYLVSNYLNPQAIQRPIWSVNTHVAITSISDFLIRTMFTRRIYILSRRNLLVTAYIVAISATCLVSGIVLAAKMFSIASFFQLTKLSNVLYLYSGSAITGDLSVSIALSWFLVRSKTGFKRTDTLINALMLYTVNTGLVVGIDAILSLVFCAIMPRNFIFLGFYLPLSKLYLNSYLATLNARGDLRSKAEDHISLNLSQLPCSHDSSSHEPTNATLQPREVTCRHQVLAISVSTNTVIEKADGQLPSPNITEVEVD